MALILGRARLAQRVLRSRRSSAEVSLGAASQVVRRAHVFAPFGSRGPCCKVETYRALYLLRDPEMRVQTYERGPILMSFETVPRTCLPLYPLSLVRAGIER
jgi:hypothetical protein